MTEQQSTPFTIEGFYKFVKEKKIMAAQCLKCGVLLLPPRLMCPKCFSKELTWKEMPKQGKLVTYTVIHVCPQQFQSIAPYAVGIIEFENGAHLPGIIKDTTPDKIKIGMTLTIDFEEASTTTATWPQWSRYIFKP